MSLLTPFKDTMRGCHAFIRGIKWLKSKPIMMFLLFLPIILGIASVALSWGYFYQYQDSVFEWIMFAKPESWWGIALYYLVKGFLFLAIVLLGFIFYALIVSVVSSPVYDYVSVVVERELNGGPAVEISLWESLKLVGEELKKVFFTVVISVGVLMIPGLNVLTPLVTAFCVGWGMYDYPFARRGWTFRKRLRFVSTHGWSVLGLGLWLLIPGLQMILMPLSVVGGSILAIEDIQNMKPDLQRG